MRLKGRVRRAATTEVPGVEPLFRDAPFFKGFPVRLPRPAAGSGTRCSNADTWPGCRCPMPTVTLLIAVTERRTREQIDGLAMALKEVLA